MIAILQTFVFTFRRSLPVAIEARTFANSPITAVSTLPSIFIIRGSVIYKAINVAFALVCYSCVSTIVAAVFIFAGQRYSDIEASYRTPTTYT